MVISIFLFLSRKGLPKLDYIKSWSFFHAIEINVMRALFIILTIALLSPITGWTQDQVFKNLQAFKTEANIKIDAHLDEADWATADLAKDFVLFSPNPGNSPRNKTEIKLMYDNTAIYIGARMYEVAADSVLKAFGPRDQIGVCDAFSVILNTYDDDVNAVEFIVSAAGVQGDIKYSSSGEDSNWNAVWISEVRIDEKGWIAEIKIPYSALRFSEKDEQVWALNFIRNNRRLNERSSWNEVDPDINGFLNQSGKLLGIQGISPPIRLAFFPYISAAINHFPFEDENIRDLSSSFSAGMDVKYGISDAFTLDMTLIPDFGQTRSDDQVLNLSAFEVRFDENRQFFTEGTELFNKGNLFYSRRIGNTPNKYYEVFDNLGETEIIKKNPSKNRLVNSTKISGRTEKGLGIGVFNSITKNMYAEIEDTLSGETRRVLTNPLTNYNVFVLDQNLKNGSFLSFVNTNVWRNGVDEEANVTATVFRLNNKKRSFGLETNFALSQIYPTNFENVQLGYSLDLMLAKLSGRYNVQLVYEEKNNTYNNNDLGFTRFNNYRQIGLYNQYHFFDPFSIFNDLHLRLGLEYSRLYQPDLHAQFGLNINYFTTFKNFLTQGLWHYMRPFNSFNHYEPRTEGRYFNRNAFYNTGFFISSDYRKRFALDMEGNFNHEKGKGRYSSNISFDPRIRISDRMNLRPGYYLGINKRYLGYTTSLDDGDIIFGERNQRTDETYLRLEYAFTEKMNLEFRARHYWSSAKNNKYFLLETDGSLASTNYTGVDSDGISLNDVSFNAFNIDCIYTWQFAPGSEMIVVWKNAISNSTTEIPDNYIQNFGETLQNPQANNFSIKLLYYVDYLYFKKKQVKDIETFGQIKRKRNYHDSNLNKEKRMKQQMSQNDFL